MYPLPIELFRPPIAEISGRRCLEDRRFTKRQGLARSERQRGAALVRNVGRYVAFASALQQRASIRTEC